MQVQLMILFKRFVLALGVFTKEIQRIVKVFIFFGKIRMWVRLLVLRRRVIMFVMYR